jgi:hypothetical protein
MRFWSVPSKAGSLFGSVRSRCGSSPVNDRRDVHLGSDPIAGARAIVCALIIAAGLWVSIGKLLACVF